MNVAIREFQPGDESAFRGLNEAWITAYFTLEDKDRATLGDPQGQILDPGGHIYVAVDPVSSQIFGCCALLWMGNGAYEVAKMAVAEHRRGQGIGRKLLRSVNEAGRALGAHRLYIETNHTLENAIALYRSEGFEHLRTKNVKPTPYKRATVFMERHL